MGDFRHLLQCSAFALALAPLPALAQSSLVYVASSTGNSVDVVSAATDKVVQSLPSEGARGINFSPDGSRIYVSNGSTSTLDVFDQKTGKLLKKVALLNQPDNIAVAKDGRILVAIARGQGAVDIIDPVRLEVVKNIPTHGPLHNIYTTADSNYVICGSVQPGVFTVIDLTTDTIAWEHKFDRDVGPMAIESNPDGTPHRIFVQLAAFDGFAVLDWGSHEELGHFKLPNLHTGVDMDPGHEDAPSHGIGVAPDGKTLWVTSIPQNAVFIYDLANLKLLGHVTLPDIRIPGQQPGGAVSNWVTFAGGKVYISNSGMRSVTAINMKTKKIVAVVPVGEVPKRISTLVLKN